MNLTTSSIKQQLEHFLASAYSSLEQRYFWFTFAMIITCVILPVFLVRVIGTYEQDKIRKREELPRIYLFKATAKLGMHYAMLFLIIAFAVENVYHSISLSRNTLVYDKLIIFLSIILLLIALTAVFFLFQFYSRGLLLSALFVVLYSAYKQYLWLLSAKAVLRVSENYKVIAKYGVYIAADYLTRQCMVMSAVAVVIVVLGVLYYYKRRYLFTPGRINLPRCSYCGKAICKGDNFCTCCGQAVKVNPIYQPVIPLDRDRHCRRCGRSINSFKCVSCNGEGTLVQLVKDKAREKKISNINGTVLLVIFFIVMLLPILSNPVDRMQRGISKINNIFIVRWDEFCDSPDVAKSAEWLAGFDSDIEALYLADLRWYYVDSKRVPYHELVFYAVYAESSFMQMEVLEQMKEFVHSVSKEEVISTEGCHDKCVELSAEINSTMSAQLSAMGNYLSENTLEMLWHIICSGVFYYISNVNILIVAGAVVIANICMLLYFLNSFSLSAETYLERWSHAKSADAERLLGRFKVTSPTISSEKILRRTAAGVKECFYSVIRILSELWILAIRICCTFVLFLNLFRAKNIYKCLQWLKEGLTESETQKITAKHRAFWRQEWILNVIAIAISVVIMGVPIAVTTYRMNDGKIVQAENQYLTAGTMATTGYARDILDILLEIESTKTLTEEEKEVLYSLIDKQVEADMEILNFEMTELEEYAEFHAGICSLCRDDIAALQRIKDSIDNGFVPSRELMLNYVSLRAENYLWVMEIIDEKFIEMFIETAYDL